MIIYPSFDEAGDNDEDTVAEASGHKTEIEP